MKHKQEKGPPLSTGLLMEDGKGGYTPATAERILEVARSVAEQRLAKGACLDPRLWFGSAYRHYSAPIVRSVLVCCFWTASTS